MAFLMRQLNTMSIGATLKSLRKRQGISLDMIAKSTNIQRGVLEAFEADRHHELPDPIYARHFLKQFVEAVHGDTEYFLARYDEECGTCPANVTELKIPRQRVARDLLRRWRPMIGKLAIALAALLLLGYIGTQIHARLSPPTLVVDQPAQDIQTTSATLEVTGQTEKEVYISINDHPVLTDPTGRFKTDVTLTRGLNIITVEARRKYGRPQVIHRSVFLEDLGGPRGSSASDPTPDS